MTSIRKLITVSLLSAALIGCGDDGSNGSGTGGTGGGGGGAGGSGGDPQRLVISGVTEWKYFDLGMEPVGDWKALEFDDSTWGKGACRCGWQDGAVTSVRHVPQMMPDFILSYYFRATFDVGNPASYANLVLKLVRDDGAVVYINGKEAARSNMPEGPVVYDTVALAAVSEGEETMVFEFPLVGTEYLKAGKNIVAVSVHQNGNNSSDIGFDLGLERAP